MPVTFQIIRERGLVYVSCKGHVTMTESQKAFRAYLAHPDFREGQAHLIDTADALSYGEDVGSSAQFELQARLAEAMPKGPEDLVLAYYAPTQIGQKMARAALQAWQDSLRPGSRRGRPRRRSSTCWVSRNAVLQI